jgi:hypothetical protein
MRLAVSSLLVTIVALVSTLPASTAIAQDEQVRLGIETPFVLLEAGDEYYTGIVRFSLANGVESDLSIELLDVWASDQRQRTTLPAGSTPTTGKDRLETRLESFGYVPDTETQMVEVAVSISAADLLKTPLNAAVKITVRPKEQSEAQGSIGIVASAVAFVFASHKDYDAAEGVFSFDVKNTDFMVSYLAESVNPSPRRSRTFIEDGLVTVSFETTNEGSLFAFVSHEISIRRAGFWVDPLSTESLIFQTEIEQSIITPGQTRFRDVPLTARLEGSDEIASLVATWGLYDIILRTISNTGQGDEIETFETITIFVFPIRQTVLTLITIALIALLAVKSRKAKPKQLIKSIDNEVGNALYKVLSFFSQSKKTPK